jgi:hypothetical protein
LRLARTLLSCSIVALALALIAAAPASAQTPRPGQLGVAAGGGLHELTAEELAAELDVARDAGARWLRFDVNWDVVQAGGPDSWAWEPFDRIVEGARARGLKVLGTIWYTPAWARPRTRPCTGRPPSPRTTDASRPPWPSGTGRSASTTGRSGTSRTSRTRGPAG